MDKGESESFRMSSHNANKEHRVTGYMGSSGMAGILSGQEHAFGEVETKACT